MRRQEAAQGKLGYPRQRRLRHKADFQRCRLEGQRFHSAHFLLYVLDREGGNAPRSGFAVSRKVGNAVRRNRIKRILREFFRLRGMSLPAFDYLLSAKRDATYDRLDFAVISAELDALIKRAAKKSLKGQIQADS